MKKPARPLEFAPRMNVQTGNASTKFIGPRTAEPAPNKNFADRIRTESAGESTTAPLDFAAWLSPPGAGLTAAASAAAT